MKIRILSIDGGGTRGILSAIILDFLEKEVRRITRNEEDRLVNYFDFVGGNSSGSIIAAMMLVPDEKGKPLYSLSDVIRSFEKINNKIFYRPLSHKIKTLWGLYGPYYSDKYLNSYLIKYLDHWRMSELIKPCAFTAYDIQHRRPVVYTSHDKGRKYKNLFVKDVVRGSVAIPAVFAPAHFRDGISVHTVIDGGLFSNNPSMVSYIEAAKTEEITDKLGRDLTPEDSLLLSVGAGDYNHRKFTYKDVEHWGRTRWMLPLLGMFVQGLGDIVTYEMNRFFNEKYNVPANFIRLNPKITLGNPSSLDSNAENLKRLEQDGMNYISMNRERLTEIAEKLVKSDPIHRILI